MRVGQVGRDLHFAEKPLRSERGGEIRPENFEGNVPVVPEVVGEVDGGHAALAQFAVDPIAVGQCGGESVGVRGHDSSLRWAPWPRPSSTEAWTANTGVE